MKAEKPRISEKLHNGMVKGTMCRLLEVATEPRHSSMVAQTKNLSIDALFFFATWISRQHKA
jgi:hypothetical protein